VLEAGHINRLGITRLGFTKTITPSGRNAATSLYRAPEILDGAPFTVKSDIYALGVILYQVLTGDFHKAMPPGWEGDIDDELLREDLGLVADENPAMRLADADVLALRLRTLDERRRRLKTQREAQARAEDSHRSLSRSRLRHAGAVVAIAALIVGVSISTVLYFNARRAQEASRIAAAQSEAAIEFLTNEVFTPGSKDAAAAKEATAAELLMRAGDEIDARFAAQPRIAAELHYLVGHSFARLNDYSSSVPHFNRAIELAQPLDGAGAAPALRSAAELVEIDYAQGHLKDTLPRYEAMLAAAQGHVVAGDAALLELKRQVALGRSRLGESQNAPPASVR
jgi:non-specific serine/threonine protein kinase